MSNIIFIPVSLFLETISFIRARSVVIHGGNVPADNQREIKVKTTLHVTRHEYRAIVTTELTLVAFQHFQRCQLA
jgi:hypothetical protein